MIIIEGTDNSGKTTLAIRLAKDLKLKVVHSPGPLDKGVKMVSWLFNEIIQQRENVIYDRISLISDSVYSSIIRKEDTFYSKRDYIEGFKELLSATPHILIFCRPSDDSIKSFGDRDQMDGVIDNTEALISGYDDIMLEYMGDPRFKVMVYNHDLGDRHYHITLDDVRYFLENKGATE